MGLEEMPGRVAHSRSHQRLIYMSWYCTEVKLPELKGTGFFERTKYLGELVKVLSELMKPEEGK
jgi:hypothetical protein